LRFATGSVLGEVIGEKNTGNSLHVALMTTALTFTSVWLDKRPRSIGADGGTASTIDSRVVGGIERAVHVTHFDIVPDLSQSLLTQVSLCCLLNTPPCSSTTTDLVNIASELVLEG
jgi:hypothetical protein